MDEELQKPNSESLTWQQQPKQFLGALGSYLETVQLIYRTKLPAEELVVWRETLKDYSLGELQRAVDLLVANPPKYEIDGEIQVWRGMPKLPDVVGVMRDFREQAAAAYRRLESERHSAEMRELERRRDAGEKFYGMADLSEAFKLMMAAKAIAPSENREAELAAQKEQLLNAKRKEAPASEPNA